MIVCDWCHGTKEIEKVTMILVGGKDGGKTLAGLPADLCGPCRTVLIGTIRKCKHERMELRPESILKEG